MLNTYFDFIITKRNRLEIVGEVKWKKATLRDVRKFMENCRDLPGKKIIVFKNGYADDSMNAEDVLREFNHSLLL